MSIKIIDGKDNYHAFNGPHTSNLEYHIDLQSALCGNLLFAEVYQDWDITLQRLQFISDNALNPDFAHLELDLVDTLVMFGPWEYEEPLENFLVLLDFPYIKNIIFVGFGKWLNELHYDNYITNLILTNPGCSDLSRITFKNAWMPGYMFHNTKTLLNTECELYATGKHLLPPEFRYNFLFFNGAPKPFRSQLIDYLVKYDLIDSDKTIVTYNASLHTNIPFYTWKWWKGDELASELVSKDGSVTYDEQGNYSHILSYNITQDHLDTFLHVVSETFDECMTVTEKSIIPMLLQRPFLVNGCPRFHEWLETYLGILPYDEIIDYSFDKEEDPNIRIPLLVEEMEKIHKMTPEQLKLMYEEIKPKLEHNARRAQEIWKERDKIPDVFYKWVYDRKRLFPNAFERSGQYYCELLKGNVLMDNNQYTVGSFHEMSDATIANNIKFINISTDGEYPKQFTMFGHFEWEPIFYDLTSATLEEFQIPAASTWCSINNNFLIKSHMEQAPFRRNPHLINAQSWPLLFSLNAPVELYQDLYYFWCKRTKQSEFNHKYNYAYIAMFNRSHCHRSYLIDEMHCRGLVDNPVGLVSWLIGSGGLETPEEDFLYYDPWQVREIDVSLHTVNSHQLPEEYFASLFDIVTESNYKEILFSEKCVKPLVLQKPFICLGAARWYTDFFDKLGFQRYDEVIDYSFDTEMNLRERCSMVAEEVKKLSQITDYQEIYQLLKPKLEYNANLFFKLRKTHTPPQIVLDMMRQYHAYKIPLDHLWELDSNFYKIYQFQGLPSA